MNTVSLFSKLFVATLYVFVHEMRTRLFWLAALLQPSKEPVNVPANVT